MPEVKPSYYLADKTNDFFYSPTYNIPADGQSPMLGAEGLPDEEARRSDASIHTAAPFPEMIAGGGPNWFFGRARNLVPQAEPVWSMHLHDGYRAEDWVDKIPLPDVYTKAEANIEKNTIEFTVDASLPWKQPKQWLTTQLDWVLPWKGGSYYVPQAETDMFCIVAYHNRQNWVREIMGLRSGDEIVFTREEAKKCFLMTLYGKIFVNGQVVPTEEIVEITSEEVVVLAEQDTIIVRYYEKA